MSTTFVRECRTRDDLAAASRLFVGICREFGWVEGESLAARYLEGPGVTVWGSWVGGRLVGLIALAEAELPIRTLPGAWPELAVAAGGRIAEISFLGLAPEGRRQELEIGLIGAVGRYARNAGITDVYAIVDDFRLAVFNRLGLPFREVKGPGAERRLFWGEKCFPAHATLQNTLHVLRRRNPRLFQAVVAGD